MVSAYLNTIALSARMFILDPPLPVAVSTRTSALDSLIFGVDGDNGVRGRLAADVAALDVDAEDERVEGARARAHGHE